MLKDESIGLNDVLMKATMDDDWRVESARCGPTAFASKAPRRGIGVCKKEDEARTVDAGDDGRFLGDRKRPFPSSVKLEDELVGVGVKR